MQTTYELEQHAAEQKRREKEKNTKTFIVNMEILQDLARIQEFTRQELQKQQDAAIHARSSSSTRANLSPIKAPVPKPAAVQREVSKSFSSYFDDYDDFVQTFVNSLTHTVKNPHVRKAWQHVFTTAGVQSLLRGLSYAAGVMSKGPVEFNFVHKNTPAPSAPAAAEAAAPATTEKEEIEMKSDSLSSSDHPTDHSIDGAILAEDFSKPRESHYEESVNEFKELPVRENVSHTQSHSSDVHPINIVVDHSDPLDVTFADAMHLLLQYKQSERGQIPEKTQFVVLALHHQKPELLGLFHHYIRNQNFNRQDYTDSVISVMHVMTQYGYSMMNRISKIPSKQNAENMVNALAKIGIFADSSYKHGRQTDQLLNNQLLENDQQFEF